MPDKTFYCHAWNHISTSRGLTLDQQTHLRRCRAPSPSWCPGSTQAQEPCAWRPWREWLGLILSFWFNLSTWSTILLPAWMTTLVASTPCTVSPSYTWLDCSQQWVSKCQDIFMGLSIRPVQWKGKLSKGKQNLRSLWRHISFQHSVSTALYDKIFLPRYVKILINLSNTQQRISPKNSVLLCT